MMAPFCISLQRMAAVCERSMFHGDREEGRKYKLTWFYLLRFDLRKPFKGKLRNEDQLQECQCIVNHRQVQFQFLMVQFHRSNLAYIQEGVGYWIKQVIGSLRCQKAQWELSKISFIIIIIKDINIFII
jgi:hypothetical protein